MNQVFRDGSLGYPLFVNGRRIDGPVTIQHLPTSGLGTEEDLNQGLLSLYRVLALAGAAAGAYHGYKRNESIGWALVWGFFGGALPVFTLPLSLAQGFGERKKG